MIKKHDLLMDQRVAPRLAAMPRTRRLVDMGCGIRPCPVFPAEEWLLVEPHGEYVEVLRREVRDAVIIQGEVEALASIPRSDTTVLLLDVIEHLDRPRGEKTLDLLAEFDHAVIFTPLGWYEQGDQNPDAWGMNGGYWQKHRSAWEPQDFPPSSWKTTHWVHWHKIGPGAILAIR